MYAVRVISRMFKAFRLGSMLQGNCGLHIALTTGAFEMNLLLIIIIIVVVVISNFICVIITITQSYLAEHECSAYWRQLKYITSYPPIKPNIGFAISKRGKRSILRKISQSVDENQQQMQTIYAVHCGIIRVTHQWKAIVSTAVPTYTPLTIYFRYVNIE